MQRWGGLSYRDLSTWSQWLEGMESCVILHHAATEPGTHARCLYHGTMRNMSLPAPYPSTFNNPFNGTVRSWAAWDLRHRNTAYLQDGSKGAKRYPHNTPCLEAPCWQGTALTFVWSLSSV